MTLAYVDLDSFKEINDRQGHATGDRVLVTVAQTTRRSVRNTDLVAGMGGDEFAPGITEHQPECRREGFREVVGDSNIHGLEI